MGRLRRDEGVSSGVKDKGPRWSVLEDLSRSKSDILPSEGRPGLLLRTVIVWGHRSSQPPPPPLYPVLHSSLSPSLPVSPQSPGPPVLLHGGLGKGTGGGVEGGSTESPRSLGGTGYYFPC